MKAIKFKGSNVVFAENQDEYKQLPAYYDKTQDEGVVVTCYKLSFVERLRVLLFGKLWLAVMTFNNPLQPQLPSTKKSDIFKMNDHE